MIQTRDPKSEMNSFGHDAPLGTLASVPPEGLFMACDAYSRPRHHIAVAGSSFLGSGSQKYSTMRLHFSMPTVMVWVVDPCCSVKMGEREGYEYIYTGIYIS